MRFFGFYFDGNSSKPISCTVGHSKEGLHVQWIDAKGDEISYFWEQHELDFYKYSTEDLVQISRKGSTQRLEVPSAEFFYLMRKGRPFSLSLLMSNRKIVMPIVGLGLFISSIFIFYLLVPDVLNYFIDRLPTTQIEQDLGNTVYDNLVLGAERDSALTVAVRRYAHQLPFCKHSSITVLQDSQVNAFALPGGKIVIFKGILEKMRSPEELAALLGHETAHVHLKHSLKLMMRSISGYLFFSLIFSDVNGIAAVLVDNAGRFQTLHFSRGFEEEADEASLKQLAASGISAKAMIDLMQTLDEATEESELEVPEFMSTHPITPKRIETAHVWMHEHRIVEDTTRKKTLKAHWEKIQESL